MQTEMDFFKISNVKVSRPVISIQDTFTLSYTLKNNGSFDAYHVAAGIMIDERDFGGAGTTYYAWADRNPPEVTIARGKSRNFSHTFTFDEDYREKYLSWKGKYPDVRAIPLTLMISFYNKFETISDLDLYNFAVLVENHYNLKVDSFELERAANGVKDDEGESVLTDLKISAAPEANVGNTTLKLYYAQNAPAAETDEYIDLTAHIPALLDGVTDSTGLIAQQFDNGSDWSFMLVFTDGYEPVAAFYTLSKSFANVHLSGASTGGVAFGKFSASEEGTPLFECEYPAIMSGGIRGVTNYALGEVPTGGRWIDGSPIYRSVIEFDVSQLNEPIVAAAIADFGVLISLGGYTYRPGNDKFMPVNFYYNDTNYCSTHVSGAGEIIMKLSHASTGYIIAEYTKKE